MNGQKIDFLRFSKPGNKYFFSMQNQAPALRHFSQFSNPGSGTCRDFFVTHHASKDKSSKSTIYKAYRRLIMMKNLIPKNRKKSS
jgi:hypothetical protein